jgi:hypothetical protein
MFHQFNLCFILRPESQVPGQPMSLQVRPHFNSIHVSWAPPAEQNIMVRGYMLGYGIGIPDVFQQLLDAQQRAFVIKTLSTYCQVFAHVTTTARQVSGGEPGVF